MTLAHIRRIRDPRKRAIAAEKHLHETIDKVDEVRGERDDAIEAMLRLRDDNGNKVYRQADVARDLGMSRSALAQRFKGL